MKKASFLTRLQFSYSFALVQALFRSRKKRVRWVGRTSPSRVSTV